MRLLITGANGQLGRELAERMPAEHSADWTDIDELDISDRQAVEKQIKADRYDLVLNCAAYTAVDKAESEPEMARAINVLGAENLARAAKATGTALLHVSTDYVFGGTANTPYRPDDPLEPIGVYGRTKREGELAVRRAHSDATILRTSWLYSSHGANIVKTILRLATQRNEIGFVIDQVGSPTYAGDLAAAVLELLPVLVKSEGRTLHYANAGVASWYDVAVAVVELAGLNCRVKPIRSEEYPTPAQRPTYSVLDIRATQDLLKAPIPHWREALGRCIKHLI